jgi:hypothetical protein
MATVARLTQNVVSQWEETELCRIAGRIVGGSGLGRVNRSGVHEHDRDIVLNGVNTAADAAFQALPVDVQNDRLFTDRADQHVKQILRDHNPFIVQPEKATARKSYSW